MILENLTRLHLRRFCIYADISLIVLEVHRESPDVKKFMIVDLVRHHRALYSTSPFHYVSKLELVLRNVHNATVCGRRY